MHLRTDLTALSWSTTIFFFFAIFIKIANMAVKIQWKTMKLAEMDAATCQQEHCLQFATAE